METTIEIALRTYKDATEHGMMDSPMNWHIWKRAFDTAERELKNLQLGAVSGSLLCDCGYMAENGICTGCGLPKKQ